MDDVSSDLIPNFLNPFSLRTQLFTCTSECGNLNGHYSGEQTRIKVRASSVLLRRHTAHLSGALEHVDWVVVAADFYAWRVNENKKGCSFVYSALLTVVLLTINVYSVRNWWNARFGRANKTPTLYDTECGWKSRSVQSVGNLSSGWKVCLLACVRIVRSWDICAFAVQFTRQRRSAWTSSNNHLVDGFMGQPGKNTPIAQASRQAIKLSSTCEAMEPHYLVPFVTVIISTIELSAIDVDSTKRACDNYVDCLCTPSYRMCVCDKIEILSASCLRDSVCWSLFGPNHHTTLPTVELGAQRQPKCAGWWTNLRHQRDNKHLKIVKPSNVAVGSQLSLVACRSSCWLNMFLIPTQNPTEHGAHIRSILCRCDGNVDERHSRLAMAYRWHKTQTILSLFYGLYYYAYWSARARRSTIPPVHASSVMRLVVCPVTPAMDGPFGSGTTSPSYRRLRTAIVGLNRQMSNLNYVYCAISARSRRAF